MTINVLLPQQTKAQIGMQGLASKGLPPVLYLLHGQSDDHTIWMRRTSIERYVSELGLAVVMPAVHRSYYTDTPAGLKYFEFVGRELPTLCNQWFRISDEASDRYVAGLSMGGYGAFKVALSDPARWAGAASLSGALDVSGLMNRRSPENQPEVASLFGSAAKIAGSRDDLFYLLAQTAGNHRVPPLFARCGTKDFLIEDNRRFIARCKAYKVPIDYAETEGADHTWEYWDATIQDALKWIVQQRKDTTSA